MSNQIEIAHILLQEVNVRQPFQKTEENQSLEDWLNTQVKRINRSDYRVKFIIHIFASFNGRDMKDLLSNRFSFYT